MNDLHIPRKFTIGINCNTNVGFPTYKRNNRTWCNINVFKKICGFAPFVERDAEKEIQKDLSQSVKEIDNVPTDGFKLIDFANCYKVSSALVSENSYVTLQDPRGWNISIGFESFKQFLKANNYTLDNGILVGLKLVYAWDSASFKLYDSNGPMYKTIKSISEQIDYKTANAKYIKPSMFKIGSIYSASIPGSKYEGNNKYMYIGTHDTYSTDAHRYAIANKAYSFDSFLADRDDVTGLDKHIFYCINSDEFDTLSLSNTTKSPYIIVNSLNKLFDKEETNVDVSLHHMYNDSTKVCSYENIKRDMKTNILFNVLDLRQSTQLVEANHNWLAKYCLVVGYDILRADMKYAWPFTNCYGLRIRMFPKGEDFLHKNNALSHIGVNIEIEANYFSVKEMQYSNSYSLNTYSPNAIFKSSIWQITNSSPTLEERMKAFDECFDFVKPYVYKYVLANGKDVPTPVNMLLNIPMRISYAHK